MKNIIISKDLKAGPNNNVLVIGAAGTGKSYSYVLPNILNATGSYVINDPGGYLYEMTGKHLRDNGYAVHVINLLNFGESERYNPLRQIKDEDGIISLVVNILEHTKNPYSLNSNLEVIKKAERFLLLACIGYLLNNCSPEDQTFEGILKLLTRDYFDSSYEQSLLDILFGDHPESRYTVWYNKYKNEAKDLEEVVVASCVYRLKMFFDDKVKKLTATTELDFESIGYEKTAVFCIKPRFITSYNFIANLLYKQIFENIIYKAPLDKNADKVKQKERIPVHFIFDEFEHLGKFINLNSILEDASEYDISFSLVVQALEQLKAVYDDWLQIVNRCDIKIVTGQTSELTSSVLDIPAGYFRFLKIDEGILFIDDKEPEIMKMHIPDKEFKHIQS